MWYSIFKLTFLVDIFTLSELTAKLPNQTKESHLLESYHTCEAKFTQRSTVDATAIKSELKNPTVKAVSHQTPVKILSRPIHADNSSTELKKSSLISKNVLKEAPAVKSNSKAVSIQSPDVILSNSVDIKRKTDPILHLPAAIALPSATTKSVVSKLVEEPTKSKATLGTISQTTGKDAILAKKDISSAIASHTENKASVKKIKKGGMLTKEQVIDLVSRSDAYCRAGYYSEALKETRLIIEKIGRA